MRTAKNTAAWVVGLLLICCLGCARHILTPAKERQTTASARPAWGPQVEGLQCRLRPVRRIWCVGETPTLKVDLRNDGPRIFAFVHSSDAPLYGLCVDGYWHRRLKPTATQGRVWPLAPGVEFTDLSVSLPEAGPAPLTHGRHTIQIAFTFEGVEVVSNPIGVEIVTSATGAAKPSITSGR